MGVGPWGGGGVARRMLKYERCPALAARHAFDADVRPRDDLLCTENEWHLQSSADSPFSWVARSGIVTQH